MTAHYKSENEIYTVVRGFELCSTGKNDFPHQSHLTVAVYYLSSSSFEQAAEMMRAGLRRFLNHHSVDEQKYNETLTLFWMKAIQKLINGLSKDLPLLEVTNAVIATLGNSRLPFEYYSSELLSSKQARSAWVEPDLAAL